MTTSDTTLPETIFSIVPARRFRTLVLMSDSSLMLVNSGSDNDVDWCDGGFDDHHARSMRSLYNGTGYD